MFVWALRSRSPYFNFSYAWPFRALFWQLVLFEETRGIWKKQCKIKSKDEKDGDFKRSQNRNYCRLDSWFYPYCSSFGLDMLRKISDLSSKLNFTLLDKKKAQKSRRIPTRKNGTRSNSSEHDHEFWEPWATHLSQFYKNIFILYICPVTIKYNDTCIPKNMRDIAY